MRYSVDRAANITRNFYPLNFCATSCRLIGFPIWGQSVSDESKERPGVPRRGYIRQESAAWECPCIVSKLSDTRPAGGQEAVLRWEISYPAKGYSMRFAHPLEFR
jgi:hypothetical protein